MVNFHVKREPSAARMPELAIDSGIAPSARPEDEVFAEKRISHAYIVYNQCRQ